MSGKPAINIQDTRSLDKSLKTNGATLKKLCNIYGTEKPPPLYPLYEFILKDFSSIKNVLEIGIGTNNKDVVSTMGSNGRPGASLRAFRDYLPNAQVYGCDVDNRILFSEERITTFFVDQTNFSEMKERIMGLNIKFDLFIDYGLHAPDANLASLLVGLSVIKPGGWVVVEDIPWVALDFWKIITYSLPETYNTSIFHSIGGGYIFTCNSISDEVNKQILR